MAKYKLYDPNKKLYEPNKEYIYDPDKEPMQNFPQTTKTVQRSVALQNKSNVSAQNGIDSGISPGNGITNVPAVKRYDPNVDYAAKKTEAVNSGNYAQAAQYEKLRNEKIGDLQLPYALTDDFNYIDRNGYGGAADRLYRQIENYNQNGFNYDYKNDPRYQQLLNQQKKEAETQYENGLAELSQRFGGDVPANLVAGLLKAKQDTIDSADSYIPQLWQMAQDMWMNEGNQLYNQYNLAAARAA